MCPIDPGMEPMLETFVFETTTLVEQLDEIMLQAEKEESLTDDNINEIFRIMHTVKGSAAMMGLDNIAAPAHSVEDLFFLVREDTSLLGHNSSYVFDLLFKASDFFRSEISRVQDENYEPQEAAGLRQAFADLVESLKSGAQEVFLNANLEEEAPDAAAPEEDPHKNNVHSVRVYFEDGSQMENIRAFMLVMQLKEYCDTITSEPPNPEKDSGVSAQIIRDGFIVRFTTSGGLENILSVIENSVNIKSYEVLEDTVTDSSGAVEEKGKVVALKKEDPAAETTSQAQTATSGKQNIISVNQSKLDKLMDLMGEIVITEAMVASSPDLKGLTLDNFDKSTRQLRKLTDELQDIVMSIRMVPLSGVFQRMNRIVRDVSKKQNKLVDFISIGGDTEVDKSINDIIGDPLMHMVRNAVDHAIEPTDVRIAAGKPEKGTVTLSAQNIGGEIVVTVEDDGQGLDNDLILAKARSRGILTRPESEYSSQEIQHLIMLPGFSTNDEVTEYSGRGVGMDVVRQNIEQLGGTLSVDSKKGVGTKFKIKIPLTLAIVDGMEISVGDTIFTIPITSINQTFKISDETKVIYDTNGSEMIMHRTECYPIIRLGRIFSVENSVEDLYEGIAVLIQSGDKMACLFADELIGEQQVVVKPFPAYLNRFDIKSHGLAGCTILGDGTISLILDASNLLNKF